MISSVRTTCGMWLVWTVTSADALVSVQPFHGAHRRATRSAPDPALIAVPPYRHRGTTRPRSERLSRIRASSSSSPQASPSSAWSARTVAELKTELKRRNLPVSGVKARLVARLEDHDPRHPAESEATATTTAPEGKNQQREIDDARQRLDNAKKRAVPPPKDDAQQALDNAKKVQETLELLEGLKFAGRSQTKKDVMPSRARPSTQSPKQPPAGKAPPPSASDATPPQSLLSSLPPLDADAQSTPADTLEHYTSQLRLKSANDLRAELSSLRLVSKGRKPDLVARLADYYADSDDEEGGGGDEEEDVEEPLPTSFAPSSPRKKLAPLAFAGIPRLSATAANALQQAFGGGGGDASDQTLQPTPIQAVAIPKLFDPPNPSALLHAPTGSGKSIAFLLPITEALWQEVDDSRQHGGTDPNDMENGMALVLLPTRELAAQVAGVASVLAPPGMVRLVPRPTDLMALWKEEKDRAEEYEYNENNGDRREEDRDASGAGARGKYRPRVLVGSAKAISTSLFGNKDLPGTPTPKPQGKALLRATRWLVLDEVDRLLHVKKSRTDRATKRHEKPAAVIAAAASRLTTGRCQVIAASATVGRPLRRELSRVLGLHSSECPETLRGEEEDARANADDRKGGGDDGAHVGRIVRIPPTVRNYVLPVDGSTSGSMLTSAAFAAKTLLQNKDDFQESNRRLLLVLTRNCGIKIHNAMGALQHFGICPAPQSLLDVLEAGGTDHLVEEHRKVSGVEGVGGAKRRKGQQKQQTNVNGEGEGEGYLLVTHEDNVRGLHLDALDAVLVVGRPGGPDEYTHIAGRTGRAGRRGSVVNIVGYEQAAALASWTKMLGVDFLPVDEGELADILDN